MPAGPAARHAIALPAERLLAVSESVWAGRDAIEEYLERLNRSSQVATRRVYQWQGRDETAMGVGSVLLPGGPAAAPDADAFMGEFRGSVGVEVAGGDAGLAAPAYMIGLPLAGAITVATKRQVVTAQAGEGLIVDPAEVLHSRLTPGMHFVEFCLPKSDVARLAGEWPAGASEHAHRHPRFAPLMAGSLAKRLLFMALQAADALGAAGSAESPSPGASAASRMMFRRWCEMIALTLLSEQRIDAPAAPQPAAGGMAPPAVRRALDYIHAHADSDIGLADIAGAACLSVSSLLRQFNARLGVSPYACLKSVRLDRARGELLADTPELVRDIALRWGFQNASKFSSAYLARFGERPSETRETRETRGRREGR